jgi:transcriptional regulator with XRE-family HTH domain
LDSALARLGRAVRAVRWEQEQSVSEVAEALGLSCADVLALEAGEADPSYDLLLALGDQLDVPPSVLICRAEGPISPDDPTG